MLRRLVGSSAGEPKVSAQRLAEMMVDADIERLSTEPEPQHHPAVVL